MASIRSFILALSMMAGSTMAFGAEATNVLLVNDAAGLWHSANMKEARPSLVESSAERLGDLAYDNHFLNTGMAPAWDFLSPLAAPDDRTARLEGDFVVFPETGHRVKLDTKTLPDVATAAEPFLLGVPALKSILAAEPYYMFRNKLTAYRLTSYTADGRRSFAFDSLPTHTIADAPTTLVAPERSGCCENMTWSVRFYDLASGTVRVFDCPPGRCGDLILARLEENGPLLLALEVYETVPTVGAVVETRLFVVSPDGTLQASGLLAHASRSSVEARNHAWAACASRVLAAEGSPYALAELSAVKPLGGNRWAFRFDGPKAAKTWIVDGISHEEAPKVLFTPSMTN